MSTLPATDLSAALLIDSGTQRVTGPRFEDTLYAPLGRLRTAARIARLQLIPGYPHDTPGGDHLPLGDADEATVRELAAILAATGTTPAPAPASAAAGMAGAAMWLRTAAQAAALDLRPGAPRIRPDGDDRLPLGDVDHDTTTRLADLIEQHLSGLYQAEDALRAALEEAGVTPERLSADGGAIELGT